ncbi:MarR family transcriptional regulator [Vibrio parahaemolyticus]|uniref:MarR family transcriptional regulator n=1 Tax=Vibrio TaxID=662 RepID=UPI00132F27E9|nr:MULTISPECIES: MarR family transcriptional regulator [Vibrio]MBE3698485.1 MarR family transcriptional regulator [Vibrio parahaemolyticus]MBE3777940.1 MarR family transcriptional regulator [Vibrio parahaemolyticus]MCZ6246285.1 MarR family transcriptional regulator [Vibrio parahaemolyticus]MDE0551209.1 MarR family transcriptional regulator [Vibrio sp. VP6]QHG93786.1 MarR family transcriptional regulator [Vibrio parahaemolyticus]
MSEESKELAVMQQALDDAKEINAAEAINISNSANASIDIGMFLGRVQMAQSFAIFAETVSLSALKEIKETKGYRELKGRTLNLPENLADGVQNAVILKGTWDEFCKLCGTSKSKVDEDLINLSLFGERALKSMQTLGVTTKDLRRLRKLPQEDLTTIVEGEVLKVQDRDEALEIIEELSAKHRQEKQALQQEVNSLTQEKQSHERLLADKDKKINSLSKKLDTPLSLAQTRQQEEQLNSQLLEQLNIAALAVDSGMARLFDAIQTIQDNEHPMDIDQACEDTLFRVLERFLSLSGDMGIAAHVIEHLEQWHSESALLMDSEG